MITRFKLLLLLALLANSALIYSQGSKVIQEGATPTQQSGTRNTTGTTTTTTQNTTPAPQNPEQEKINEIKWLTIQPGSGTDYDQSSEAAARADAIRKRNAQKSDINNPNRMSYWTSRMSQAFADAMATRREEERRAQQEWEQQLKQEKANLQRLKDGYKKEVMRQGKIGVGQRNIAAYLINGGEIRGKSASQLNTIYNLEESSFSLENTPYAVSSIYENSDSEYIYMFNYYNSAPSSISNLEFNLKLSAARDAYLGCNTYYCLSREFEKRGYGTPYIGVSSIVAIPKTEFLDVFPTASSLANFMRKNRMYANSNASAIFNKKSDELHRYNLLISTSADAIQALHAGLSTIYVPGVQRKEIQNPLGSVQAIRENIDQLTNSKTVEPVYSDRIVDTRNNAKYKTVKIGNQIWMAENFKIKGGVFIKKGDENYYYDASTASLLCPQGWRIPNKNDLVKLGAYIEEKHGVAFNSDNAKSIFEILENNYDFVDYHGKTGYVQMNFDRVTERTFSSDKEYKNNEKYKRKLRDWYAKKWIDTREIPQDLQNGTYNTIPGKFLKRLGKTSGNYHVTYTTLKQPNRIFFWLNDLKFEGDRIERFYTAAIGNDKLGAFYDDTLDSSYPCRCIKE
ncbi:MULTISPECIES: FISUMP domain-containing protein [unclassified Leeuwenhoekiella]|uniref:FISUMP domain-containing protein n=1 Tax=unclassified Leeuwenhoekiella TaxID=2615029 RepID=UPI000C3C9293|nr:MULTISPECIES: FISUMP domain-containing protein [unclassified Leeuwenhoekiella]MAW96997.1 hypothetical protein [Leeuwenhoekiella sp.]MBA80721.1 hypothetical protein [Leeuwenhoekiella sp.]|tara:strand:+ start:411 stop:2285 length:1875 start_codon:yes stop_codon:yes gene_type:complete